MTEAAKVLVIGLNYAPEHTGIAPYTTGIARSLASDTDVQVLTAHPHYPSWRIAEGYGEWRRDEQDSSVLIRRLRHYVPRHPTGVSRILSEASFAARVLATRLPRPDVVIAVTPALLSVVSARILATRWGVPSGVIVQDLYSRAMTEIGLLGGSGAKYVTALEAAALRGADGLVAIHDRFADSMVRGLGVDRNNIRVIPNWTHVDPPKSDREAVRKRLGWEGHTVLLHAGNMGAKQGLGHVVAAAAATREDPSIRFVLMGDGSQRPALERQAFGIPNVAIADGVPNDEFSDVLAAADVLLLHEGPGVEEMCVPSKLTSYFAAGRPVLAVTSRRSAAAHEIEQSGAGILVEPGDPAGLIDGLTHLTDTDRLDEIGRRGQTYAKERLSEQSSLDAYRDWVLGLTTIGRRR